MKFLKLLPVLVISAILLSCAAPRINPETTKNLKDSKIAVAYVQVEKRISHNEKLYRVFWWDIRQLDVFFDGMWDADKELTDYIVPKFTELGLHATSIYTVASKKDIAELHKSIKDNTEHLKKVGQNAYVPISEPIKNLVLNKSLRQSLKKNNIDYLVTLNNRYIYTETIWGVRSIRIIPYLSVININSNEEQYPGGGLFTQKTIKSVKSTREIESNNLARLKSEMKELLEICITRFLPERLGLVQEDNT